VCWVDPEKNPRCSEQDLLESLKNACPDLDSLLAKRQGMLRRLCGRTVKRQTLRTATPKIGRNAPCPCGIGKKWKDAAEPDLCAPVLPHPVCARITYENSRPGVQPLEQRWVAAASVTRIDERFAIDAEARRQALSLEAHALPQQQSRPLWDEIYESRSKAHARRHCLGARRPRPATACLPCGTSSRASWNVRNRS
jgi:hypothetical protein